MIKIPFERTIVVVATVKSQIRCILIQLVKWSVAMSMHFACGKGSRMSQESLSWVDPKVKFPIFALEAG